MIELIKNYTEIKFNLLLKLELEHMQGNRNLVMELGLKMMGFKSDIIEELLSNDEIMSLKSEKEITDVIDEVYNKIINQIFSQAL